MAKSFLPSKTILDKINLITGLYNLSFLIIYPTYLTYEYDNQQWWKGVIAASSFLLLLRCVKITLRKPKKLQFESLKFRDVVILSALITIDLALMFIYIDLGSLALAICFILLVPALMLVGAKT